MQLQVHTWTRTWLIIQKEVKKQLYFDDFQTTSTTPGFLARDVTHDNISHRVWISRTQNTLRMPKMYTFMGIWAILEKLLSFKVTATLRRKWNKKRQVAQEYMTTERPTYWPTDKQTDTDIQTERLFWQSRNLAYFNNLQGITLHIGH